jgi:hypothetical protein
MIYKRGCDKKVPGSSCGKRGSCGVYWYKFIWQGKLVRKSRKQGNDKVAGQMEAAHRTSLAKGEVGIRDKKVVPMLSRQRHDVIAAFQALYRHSAKPLRIPLHSFLCHSQSFRCKVCLP